jgi:hypothetical protein
MDNANVCPLNEIHQCPLEQMAAAAMECLLKSQVDLGFQNTLSFFPKMILLLKVYGKNKLHYYTSELLMATVVLKISELPSRHLSYYLEVKHLTSFNPSFYLYQSYPLYSALRYFVIPFLIRLQFFQIYDLLLLLLSLTVKMTNSGQHPCHSLNVWYFEISTK